MSDTTLAGRTVLVTGASRGIGRAIALRAAADGANVVIAAKTSEPHPKLPGTIHSVASEVEQAGGHALAVQVDLRDEEQVVAAVEATVERFGGIDVLVNNAGAVFIASTEHTSLKRFDLMHQINMRGAWLMSKLCAPILANSENPHIVMISPPLDLHPRWLAPHLAYTLSKYGMSMAAVGLAAELAPAGIAVNAVWPKTTIATAAILNLLGGEAVARRSRHPEMVGDAVHAVITRPASEYTGNLVFDEDVLREAGVDDFSRYAVDPEAELQPDLYTPEFRGLG
jgi:citronellol/citronellal dehydrogenase